MAGSFIQGAMNKGNILFSHSERVSDTPQPDGSVVKTSVFKHLGFIYIPSGIMVLKRAASASLIMSLYLSNQVPT
jgi:hypothetical protein